VFYPGTWYLVTGARDTSTPGTGNIPAVGSVTVPHYTFDERFTIHRALSAQVVIMAQPVKSEQEAALEEINVLLDQTRPKHVGTGITSGIGYILAGAVGACGIAVLSPVVAAKGGAEKGGVVGAVTGGVGGAVVGLVQAANVAGGGLVSGAGQMVRGLAATPSALTEPRLGKWWNDAEGRWIYSDLEEDRRWLLTCPTDDSDILVFDALDPETFEQGGVKDPFFYDVLNVDPSVNASVIKRQYYILARKYSPDRAGDSQENAEKLRNIGYAYVILTNDEMRDKYDKYGRNFMNIEEMNPPLVDPIVLYRVLYGSEKFEPYFGRLAAATSASVGDSPKISLVEARTLQKRRVTRMAIQLAERLKVLTKYKGDEKIARANWMAEADYLVKASYGYELLQVVGKVYSVSAIQFLGSMESGIGLPSVANWAKKQLETMKHVMHTEAGKAAALAGDFDKMVLESAVKKSDIMYDETMTDQERNAMEDSLRAKVGDHFLHYMWKTTVVDITNTIHEAAQIVLHDQSVLASIRKKRGLALQLLGEIFIAQPALTGSPSFDRDGQKSYEEVAFSAIVETIVRKEKSYQWARSELEAKRS